VGNAVESGHRCHAGNKEFQRRLRAELEERCRELEVRLRAEREELEKHQLLEVG
jgi:flagellar motility protein MotE (MotC chaperone)